VERERKGVSSKKRGIEGEKKKRGKKRRGGENGA